MIKLTPKQERFAKKFVELDNAFEAYGLIYSTKNMSDNAVYVEASRLLNHPKISLRIKELKEHHANRHDVTVDTITNELEEARQMAIKTETPSAMVTASMGKAKLHGIVIDKASVDVTVNPIEELMNSVSGTALRPK